MNLKKGQWVDIHGKAEYIETEEFGIILAVKLGKEDMDYNHEIAWIPASWCTPCPPPEIKIEDFVEIEDGIRGIIQSLNPLTIIDFTGEQWFPKKEKVIRILYEGRK